eukprot:g4978.t1
MATAGEEAEAKDAAASSLLAASQIAEAAIAGAYPGASPTFDITSTKVMGFSGAVVLGLTVRGIEKGGEGKDEEERLVLKLNPPRLASLAADADAAARLRAQRTDDSFANEVAFLKSPGLADKLVTDIGCRIPRPVYVSNEGDQGFCLLMESLSHWQQHFVVPAGPATTAALDWLARFHAAFLPKESGGSGLPTTIVPGGLATGTHLALSKRPAAELEQLAETMAAFADRFAAAEPYWGTPEARDQGRKLQAVAAEVSRALAATRVTRVHGDFKSGNFFFREEGGKMGGGDGAAAGAAAVPSPQLAVIDWQWSGPGNAMTDLVYLCTMALEDTAVDDWRGIVREYHGLLMASSGGGAGGGGAGGGGAGGVNYPYADLEREFKLALLDFHRWQCGARLKSHTPEAMAARAANPDINKGHYMRSLTRQKWIWQRAEEFLAEVDELLVAATAAAASSAAAAND